MRIVFAYVELATQVIAECQTLCLEEGRSDLSDVDLADELESVQHLGDASLLEDPATVAWIAFL